MKNSIISFIIILFLPLTLLAQNNQNEYNWFDKQVGIENTGLFSGIEYIEFEKGINGFTKFLYPDNFSTGFISYNGQTYYDVALKYNVYDDKVIVNIGQNSGKKVFEIFAAKIDSFSIDIRKFIQIKNKNLSGEIPALGFSELILDAKNLRLFKKLSKEKLSKIKNKSLFFEYKWNKPKYTLLFNDFIYEVKRKQDFIDIFPQFKTEIRQIEINKNMAKNNPDIEVVTISNKINSLLSNGL